MRKESRARRRHWRPRMTDERETENGETVAHAPRLRAERIHLTKLRGKSAGKKPGTRRTRASGSRATERKTAAKTADALTRMHGRAANTHTECWLHIGSQRSMPERK